MFKKLWHALWLVFWAVNVILAAVYVFAGISVSPIWYLLTTLLLVGRHVKKLVVD